MGKRPRSSEPASPPPAGGTHYDTLGITPKATSEQIRRAYRALARRHHPDVNPAPDAAAMFAQVQTAYAVLIDPERRRQYDAALAAAALEARTSPAGTAHYTWRNIATETVAPDPNERSELDDLYDAFFGSQGD
jgi:curved DNA-binding protein CbpA